jgi:hypothetical protein
MEKVIKAAIEKDGCVQVGKRHCDILNAVKPFGYLKDGTQGFVTSTGRFVTREIAAKIAYEAGQIKEPKRLLFSEDLY